MKQISLTQGKFAIVDDNRYESLSKYKWYVLKAPYTYYAARWGWNGKKKTNIFMHREILGLRFKDKILTDHRNHNGLDNRLFNLRSCDSFQNQQNGKRRKNGSSKFKGVCWHKIAQKWQAQIKFKCKFIYLGSFDNEIEAAKAYDTKAKELFGEFACTNF